jgi:lauroyl/myristoyl acyltransferase
MRRVARGRYSVRLIPLALPPFEHKGRDADAPIMERFARQLETAIQESPADWLWLQKRWKYPRPERAEETGSRRRGKR